MDLFALLPPRLGGLDMILPLLYEIKQSTPGSCVHLIFLEEKVYSDLRRDPFLFSEVNTIADTIVHFRKPFRSGFSYLRASVVLMAVVGRILTAKRALLLQSRGVTSGLTGILHRVVKFKKGATYQHFNGMALNIGKKNRKETLKQGEEGDAFLCFSQHDVAFFNSNIKDRVKLIGYPFLYPGWKKRIQEVASTFLEQEATRCSINIDQGYVLLLLGSSVKDLYNPEELLQWIDDVLTVVEQKQLNLPVLIKPHPMEKPDLLDEIRQTYCETGLRVMSFLHPAILATKAKLAVAHHTSTIIMSMSLGIPTIQYQEFTEHWLKRHPEGSGFLQLGPLWAKNRSELTDCFNEAMSENFSVPDIAVPLKHNKDLSFLKEKV